MREIKFRAFQKKENKMYNDVQSTYDWEFMPTKTCEDEYWVLMQYTDLKDKNGKEIYEGDIVLHDGEKIVVKYGCQEVDAFEGIGFNLWSFIGEQNKFNCSRLQSELEVIGNIYQNPELLK